MAEDILESVPRAIAISDEAAGPDRSAVRPVVRGDGPRAMSRVLRLFELLARNRYGMTLSAISAALDVPKSTFLSSLRALTRDGLLLCEGNLYRLGPGAFRLAGTILSSWSMPEIVRHFVQQLARSTGESVGFAIVDWEIGQAIYTDAVNSTQAVPCSMRAGIRIPLYASAAGRVLLAFASSEHQEEYLDLVASGAMTPANQVERESIAQSLALIRDQGYCATFGEMLTDSPAIAVPVYDGVGTVIGALMLAAPFDRMRSNFDKLRADVIETGRRASGLTMAGGGYDRPDRWPDGSGSADIPSGRTPNGYR